MFRRHLTARRLVGATAAAVLVSTPVACTTDRAAAPSSTTQLSSTEPSTTQPSPTQPSTTQPSVTNRRPFEVERISRTYERVATDGSSRTLLVEMYSPVGEGTFPVVVFAHGNDGHPRKFQELFTAWATAGYVVLAPRFPVSADDADRDLAASVADAPEQELDLAFVVERAAEEAAGGTLDLRADLDRMVIAGLSLGGGTALRAAYSGCCPALRPRLVVAFSPVPFATTQEPGSPPLLLVHGTADLALPYRGTADYFATATARRWFVTLDGGGHADPYEDAPSPFDPLVIELSTAFFDEFAAGDSTGVARATTAVEASGNARIEQAG